MATLITYPLQVPDEPAALVEVGDFQAGLLRKYLGEAPGNDVSEYVAGSQARDRQAVGWLQDRSEIDAVEGEDTPHQDALLMYSNVSPNARGILDQLIDAWREDEDDASLLGEAIARRLNLEPPQFRGTQASLEMRARALNRPKPVCFKPGPHGGRYWLDHAAAPAFEWARRNYEADKRLLAADTAYGNAERLLATAHDEVRDIKHAQSNLLARTDSDAEAERMRLGDLLRQAEEELAARSRDFAMRENEMVEAVRLDEEIDAEVS